MAEWLGGIVGLESGPLCSLHSSTRSSSGSKPACVLPADCTQPFTGWLLPKPGDVPGKRPAQPSTTSRLFSQSSVSFTPSTLSASTMYRMSSESCSDTQRCFQQQKQGGGKARGRAKRAPGCVWL